MANVIKWDDYAQGKGFELSEAQRSPQWFEGRMGRLTGSNVYTARGQSRFKSAADTATEILKGPSSMNDRGKLATSHGIMKEPEAREMYEKVYKKVVLERSLVVPRFDLDIGASTDGDVIGERGIIEIKCPVHMYEPIREHIENMTRDESYGKTFSQETGNARYPYIKGEHYDQMQLTMKVLDKEWCDYVVYCTPESSAFVARVYFDKLYWDEQLYPSIRGFVEQLKPQLGKGYPVRPELQREERPGSPNSDDITL